MSNKKALLKNGHRFLTVTVTLIMCSSGASANGSDLDSDKIVRGAYLLRAAGCVACHTDLEHHGEFLAGGRPIETPFGTFYTPNITADPNHGIGSWEEHHFITAMTKGISPDNTHYYPVFPYTAYSAMRLKDLSDLWAYLRTVSGSNKPNRKHHLGFPFSFRTSTWVWKLIFFHPKTYSTDPTRSPEWNRGAYLVSALGHCHECHTSRNFLGATKRSHSLAGTTYGPDNEKVPNITPDIETGIGDWAREDITWLLQTGFLPDGDVVGSSMADVVEHSTSHLTAADQSAIAVYLQSLTPIHKQLHTNAKLERNQSGSQ